MRPGKGSLGSRVKRRSQRRDRDVSTQSAKSPGHSWTHKTMHHPATRIGEMKRGKP